jgi:WD40 repeat protein
MTTASGDKAGPKRPDVFISYSRKDREFVKRLEAELQSRGREAWVDWEGIRPAEEFMQAIFPAIEGTDTFVFVLSPDSVSSEICGRELGHAVSHNKRMIPIMARDVEAKAVPEPLAKLNWVFARDADSFEAAADFLISALDTDLDWVHAHTRLLTRAIEWEAKSKSNSFVLRGEDLRAAEHWLAQAGTEKERQPTALQTEYIIASRKAAARRQRITLGAVSFGLVVALVLAVLAFYQRNLAEERRRLARARELATEARLEVSSPEDGLQRSALLAIESLNSAWTLDGFIACLDAIKRLPRRPLVRAAHNGKVLALAFSKDNRWLASESANGEIVIWDTRAQKQITLDTHGSGMPSAALAFSPDGRWLASASAQAALVWDTTTWKLGKKLPHPGRHAADNKISSVAFNPDGSLLATATHYSSLVAMYNTATWEVDVAWAEAMKKEPEGKSAQVVAFSPNGKWLVTGVDGLAIWDTATKKKIARIERMVPWSLAFRPDDGALAVGGQNGDLQLLEIPKDFVTAEHELVFVATGGGASISALSFAPSENRLASARLYGSGSARVWNLLQNIWEPGVGRPELALELPCSAAAMVFSPEGGAVITGNADGTIATWPLTDGAAVEVLRHTAAVTAVTFSRSGELLVTASDALRIFKAGAAGWSVVSEKKLPSTASTIGFSPDGLWLVAIVGNTVQLFSTGTWIESPPSFEHARDVVGVSFSPDGKWMATRTKRVNHRAELVIPSRTQIWDLATRREVAWATHPDEDYREINGFAGKIVSETGGDTKLEALSASWEVLRLGDHASQSSDGRWSIAGGKLSEVQSGRELNLVKHEGAINDAAFSPDGHWLVTASNDRTVRFWPLRSEELRTEAMARLGRNLTYDEWHKFFPDEPYSRTCAAVPVHPSVRDKARELATAGDVKGATTLFRQILKAEPTSPFDPAAEARKIAGEAKRAKESTPENLKQPSQEQTP